MAPIEPENMLADCKEVNLCLESYFQLPVEHNPLRDGHNTLLRLIESGELCFHGIICIRHDRVIFVARIEE